MNLRGWFDRRKAERMRKEALAGRASSGHLNPGERDRLLRLRRGK